MYLMGMMYVIKRLGDLFLISALWYLLELICHTHAYITRTNPTRVLHEMGVHNFSSFYALTGITTSGHLARSPNGIARLV